MTEEELTRIEDYHHRRGSSICAGCSNAAWTAAWPCPTVLLVREVRRMREVLDYLGVAWPPTEPGPLVSALLETDERTQEWARQRLAAHPPVQVVTLPYADTAELLRLRDALGRRNPDRIITFTSNKTTEGGRAWRRVPGGDWEEIPEMPHEEDDRD